jgi:hypothetical protein
MQWFQEFAINPQDSRALRQIFRDETKPVLVKASVEYGASEREFLTEHGSDLIWPIAWQRVTGQRMDYWTFSRMGIMTQLEHFRPAVEAQVESLGQQLRAELQAGSSFDLEIELQPDGNMVIHQCLPASVSLQSYAPESLGVIEYHSASRAYPRQALQGINLDARSFEDQRRQQSLYNWQGKYQNVKSELAAGYLRALIAEKSDQPLDGEDLNETLKELFKTFFPDKTYEGVKPLPGGSLEFPVRLADGPVHDIDDLSSGEKEILYGYLRLRNSTPRNSVILFDEPELHLNPSLLQGMTDFYHRHLGEAQGNQLWLVTHSDALLRQAVGNENYDVYHMSPASATTSNQASRVVVGDDVAKATIDLVGDLAAYRPHAKVVILEGEHEDAFDERLVRRLFPDFAKRVNLVSGGPKRRVRDLYRVLELAASSAGIENRFFAIVDKDSERDVDAEPGAKELIWPVYHIENFLLESEAIRGACLALTGEGQFATNDEVTEALKASAEQILGALVLDRVRAELNREIVESIDLGGHPAGQDVMKDLMPALQGTMGRLTNLGVEFSQEKITGRIALHREEFEAALISGDWLSQFPGRSILKRFGALHLPGQNYETLRNAIVDKLATAGQQPPGMADVLRQILET